MISVAMRQVPLEKMKMTHANGILPEGEIVGGTFSFFVLRFPRPNAQLYFIVEESYAKRYPKPPAAG